MAWRGDLGGHARWCGHAQAAATLDWHASWRGGRGGGGGGGGGALLTGAARPIWLLTIVLPCGLAAALRLRPESLFAFRALLRERLAAASPVVGRGATCNRRPTRRLKAQQPQTTAMPS